MKKFAVPAGLFLAGFVFFGFYSLLGIDFHHDGIMFKAAVDAANGAAVFKGSFSQYGILPPLLQGLAVRIFGAELIVLKLLTAVFYGLALVVYDCVWKRFFTTKETKYRVFYILLYFLLSADCCVTAHPWASVYALLFQLVTILLTLKFFESSKLDMRYAAASGVAAAVVFGFRQPCGLTTILAAILISIIAYSRDRRAAQRFAGAFSAGLFAVLAVYAIAITCWGAWHDYWIQTWVNAFTFAVKRGAGNGSWGDVVINFFPFVTGDRGFVDAIFAVFPLVTLGLLARVFLTGSWKENIPLVAVMIYSLGAWHQYYPVPCMRHLYWASVPMMGVFVYAVKELIQKGGVRGRVLAAVLFIILLFPVSFRTYFACRRIKGISSRETADIPGVRGLYLFRHEKQLCTIFHTLGKELPPKVAARGVFNHTPDGIWSVMLPDCGWRHPLFCRVAETAYPEYDREAFRFCLDRKPVVISTTWQSLPGYALVQPLICNGVTYFVLFPEM